MWVVLCFDSPEKRVLLRQLTFRSLSEIARCLRIARTTLSTFYLHQGSKSPYLPLKGIDYKKTLAILKHVRIERLSDDIVNRVITRVKTRRRVSHIGTKHIGQAVPALRVGVGTT